MFCDDCLFYAVSNSTFYDLSPSLVLHTYLELMDFIHTRSGGILVRLPSLI